MASTNVWEMSSLNFERIYIKGILDLTPQVINARYMYDMFNLVNYGTGNPKIVIHDTSVCTDILHKKIGPLCY